LFEGHENVVSGVVEPPTDGLLLSSNCMLPSLRIAVLNSRESGVTVG
jgi:hypothetical protein